MISSRKRQLAARMCSIVASTPGFHLWWGWESINGITQPIADLVFAAHDRASWEEWTSSERWAEAEALLRTGWTP